MRTVIVVAAAISIVALGIVSPASAFEGGGKKPSEAPLTAYGVHYAGNLGNNQAEANYAPVCCNDDQVAIYHLGPLAVHDRVAINWHALPFVHESGFPVSLVFVENVDDYTWGATLGREEGLHFQLAGSGTARSEVTVQNSSANDYLEFFSRANETDSQDLETYLYDFSVEAPRHYLTLSFPSFTSVAANGTVSASITGATGLPAPDGLIYTLTANWKDGGVAISTAPSGAGRVTFPLALPESAFNQRVRFIVSRAPDAEYQAVESPAVSAKVTAPVATAVSSACKRATAHAYVLARQHHRLQAHSRRARGLVRKRLRRRARHVAEELHVARSKAASACAVS